EPQHCLCFEFLASVKCLVWWSSVHKTTVMLPSAGVWGGVRAAWPGVASWATITPLLLLSGSFVGVAVQLASWHVCWVGVLWGGGGSRSCLSSDWLGNDNPLPLSSVALW
uniref:Uncharacterized protein n=1 Tax=Oryza glaberrima TaxID=4538 RepID=I1PCX4_ORYGL